MNILESSVKMDKISMARAECRYSQLSPKLAVPEKCATFHMWKNGGVISKLVNFNKFDSASYHEFYTHLRELFDLSVEPKLLGVELEKLLADGKRTGEIISYTGIQDKGHYEVIASDGCVFAATITNKKNIIAIKFRESTCSIRCRFTNRSKSRLNINGQTKILKIAYKIIDSGNPERKTLFFWYIDNNFGGKKVSECEKKFSIKRAESSLSIDDDELVDNLLCKLEIVAIVSNKKGKVFQQETTVIGIHCTRSNFFYISQL